MRGILAGVAVVSLLVPVAAQAGEITSSGTTMTYTGDGGANAIVVRRSGDNISFTDNGGGPLTESSSLCDPPVILTVTCNGAATSITRIVTNGFAGDDSFQFNDLGSITAEGNGGDGNDVVNVVDQSSPFVLVATGGAGQDTLLGGVLGDSLDGGADGDALRGYAGPDNLTGGTGLDRVGYDGEMRAGVRISLDDVADDGNQAASEQDNVHSDVEDVYGTEVDDVIVGSAAGNLIDGLGGADDITGGGGADLLLGNAGDDTIRARDGIADRADCGGGTDSLTSDTSDTAGDCETNDASNALLLDGDFDGSNRPADCDDANPAIRPGLADTPDDGIDQDCSGADTMALDRDGDNVNRPLDCDDTDAAIRPGAAEVKGNAVDENCDGKVVGLPKVKVGISVATRPVGLGTRFTRLVVRGLRTGDRVRISCRPEDCGVRTASLRVAKAGTLDLARRLDELPAGARLEIRVQRAGFRTAVLRLTMRAHRPPKLTRP